MKVKFVVIVVIETTILLLLGWADWPWRLLHTKHPHRVPAPKSRHLFSNRSHDETAPDVPWKPEYSGSRLISYRPAKHIYPRNTIQPARVVSAPAVLRTLPWKPEYSGSRLITYRPAKHIYPRNTIQPARVVSAPAVLRTPDAEGARLSGLLREFSGSYRDIPADRDAATSAEFTEFHIPHPGSFYRVGAILFVTIRAKDMRNREKTVGGDFFRAKIYTEWTKSSAPGRVRDYGNGTYGVTFRLLWTGIVTVSVRMVHSSSAVRVLKRLREEFPTNRAKFRRRYVSGNRTSDGWCSSHRSDLHSPEGGGICDFSDRYASVEWYCERPWNVTCDQSVYHGFDWFRSVQELGITEEEKTYFKKGEPPWYEFTAIKSIIKVKKGTTSTILVVGHQDGDRTEQLPRCMPGLPAPLPSGYYRNGRWVSRVCQGPRLTNAYDWKKCLQNSALDFLGDSTTRQWFYYMAKYMQMEVRNSPYFLSLTAGPIYAEEKQWNITSRYQSHGPPINTVAWVNASILSNLVRIIDEIDEPNHIVVVTVGFHFNSHPLVDYVTRVRTVRSALLRLLRRQQNTTLVIKPTNTADTTILNVDDWYSFQMYLIIKEMFSGLPVVFVDTWEMTDCQFPKDTVHPADEVIQEEILYMLSYICQ